MKKTALLAFVIVLLSTTVSLGIISSLRLQMAYASPYIDISVDAAYNMITSGSYPDLVVLDVRRKDEYDSGHIYGAVWIPVSELDGRIGELAGHEDHEIIVYCGSGGRSVTASGILDSHGFTKVYNMLGGISAWQAAGYPVWIPEEDALFWMQWWLWAIVAVVIVALAGAVYFLKKRKPPTPTAPTPPTENTRDC